MNGLKLSSLFVFLAFLVFTTTAQQPQEVYSFVKVNYPDGFYEEQIQAWGTVIKEDPQNASAWYNYYKAHRYVRRDNEDGDARTQRLNEVVEKMGQNVPDSYEYHLAVFRNDYNPVGNADHLLKAYKMDPDRPDTYEELLTYYLIRGNERKYREFAQKLYHSGEPSPGLLNYGFNMITGLDANAILLTNGDNDTYPAWLMQVGEGTRQDVRVINVHLLKIESYRDRIFDELGIHWDIDLSKGAEMHEAYKKELIKKLSSNKKGYPVYAAITLSEDFTQPVRQQLYLTGLAFRYYPGAYDNIAQLKHNFEQRYALDYLQNRFGYDISRGIVNRMNQNYIVPILHLYDHYKLAHDIAGKERMKKLALMVAQGTPDEQKVKEYF